MAYLFLCFILVLLIVYCLCNDRQPSSIFSLTRTINFPYFYKILAYVLTYIQMDFAIVYE